MQGNRVKNDEIVRLYIEEFFRKINEAERSFSAKQRLSYKERREDA